MEKLTVYIKDGKNYIETYTTTDALTIYQRLTNTLIAKKIIVIENNGCKSEYIIKD